MNRYLAASGKLLSRIIQREVRCYKPYSSMDPMQLARVLRPADVLLIEGNQQVSVAIKYLTQSTWSHAAMYIGEQDAMQDGTSGKHTLVEVDLDKGCHVLPLSRYRNFNVRICRPHALTPQDRELVIRYMTDRIGTIYDLKNIFDLLRYLIPTPPVPVRWRRRMIALGSGDPTRAICSSLIAQAFQSVRYPILPTIQQERPSASGSSGYSAAEIYHIRHHSLFAPRDFDISPYFSIIKPAIENGLNYKAIVWADDKATPPPFETC